MGQVNGPGVGNGVVGNITNGTLNLYGNTMYIQNGTVTANLTGGGTSRVYIGGDAAATVNLGGVNTVSFTDHHSTLVGEGTTGGAGTVKILSATALGSITEEAQLYAGTLDLNGQQNITVNNLLLANGSLSRLINNNTAAPAIYTHTMQIDNVGTEFGGIGDMVLGGVISGFGGINKTGAGVATLTAANVFSGGATITFGSLQIGNATASGTLGTSSVTNNATLIFNRTDVAPPVANAISGTGTVVQAGSGTTTLSGANFYSGPTTISAGTLLVDTGSQIAPSVATVASAGTLGGVGAHRTDCGERTVSPGMPGVNNGVGTLTAFGDVTFNAGSKFVVDIHSATASDTDYLDISNHVLNITGGTIVIRAPAFATSSAVQYHVATYSSTQAGAVPFSINQASNLTGKVAGVGYSPNAGAPPLYINVNFGGAVAPVKIDAFSATSQGAGVLVEWTAVSEFRNAGFNIYRRAETTADWTRVNSTLIFW